MTSDYSCYPFVDYTYTVYKKKYKGYRIFPSIFGWSGNYLWAKSFRNKYKSNQKIKVFYNPKKPYKSYLEKKLSFPISALTYLCTFIIFIFCWYILHKKNILKKIFFFIIGILWYINLLCVLYLYIFCSNSDFDKLFYFINIAYGLYGILPFIFSIFSENSKKNILIRQPFIISLIFALLGSLFFYLIASLICILLAYFIGLGNYYFQIPNFTAIIFFFIFSLLGYSIGKNAKIITKQQQISQDF